MRYFGKYRGTVVSNEDPLGVARIQASVPDVLGLQTSGWAMPSLPFAGPGCGCLAIPPVGAGVWVEFEGGDPDFPIWSGCFWRSSAELPAAAQAAAPGGQAILLQTGAGTHLRISDQPSEGLTLSTAAGATIVVNDAGITISNGQGATIILAGPTVTINEGALEVT